MRALLTAVAVLALSVSAAACTSSTSTDRSDQTAVDVNDPTALKQATDVEGMLPVGSQTTLEYTHKSEYTTVPYLAVQLVSSTQTTTTPTGDQQVVVTGKFPGTPEVIVVDANYAVIATTSTVVVNADGTSTNTTLVPRDSGAQSVLVHDPMWSAPMSFEVSIGD